jgi:hypothetical protein
MTGRFVEMSCRRVFSFTDAFKEAALNQKASGQSATVGATAGIDTEIERGMDAATIVDAIMQNVYRNNPVKLAAWAQARHIKRSPQRKPKATQQP